MLPSPRLPRALAHTRPSISSPFCVFLRGVTTTCCLMMRPQQKEKPQKRRPRPSSAARHRWQEREETQQNRRADARPPPARHRPSFSGLHTKPRTPAPPGVFLPSSRCTLYSALFPGKKVRLLTATAKVSLRSAVLACSPMKSEGIMHIF